MPIVIKTFSYKIYFFLNRNGHLFVFVDVSRKVQVSRFMTKFVVMLAGYL